MSLANPRPKVLLMSLLAVVAVISLVGAMSQVKSQSILTQLVGTWAVCTLDRENCVKIKVHQCKEDGEHALCSVSLP